MTLRSKREPGRSGVPYFLTALLTTDSGQGDENGTGGGLRAGAKKKEGPRCHEHRGRKEQVSAEGYGSMKLSGPAWR